MTKAHYFVDEAGDFTFSPNGGASKYFIITSVVMEDCSQADVLVPFRRELEQMGTEFRDWTFHATVDHPTVRERVFKFIAQMDIRVDATIFEKSKTVPHRQAMLPFYKMAWYHHASNTMRQAVDLNKELHIVAGSIGTKNEAKIVISEIRDVVYQCGRKQRNTSISIVPALADPGLQIADYCCWAIQRKWTKNDDQSWKLIKHHIKSEYDFFQRGRKHYYEWKG